MDKYEFNIKVEQIKKLISKGDYDTAMKIADTIDWRRVRNANLLSMIAEVYEKNDEFQEAKEILLLAFERAPIGKRLLYKLAELALKEGNAKEAEDYYREFCDLAPDDPRQHLLRYLILREKKAPAEQLIHSLESYTSTELDEKWLYELAELYCKDGKKDECIRTCDKIMMLFGLGKYVDKAMELKVQFAPLSGYQIDLIENRDKYEEKLRAVEQEFGDTTRRMMQDDYDEDDQEEDGQEEDSQAKDSQAEDIRADMSIQMEDPESPYGNAESEEDTYPSMGDEESACPDMEDENIYPEVDGVGSEYAAAGEAENIHYAEEEAESAYPDTDGSGVLYGNADGDDGTDYFGAEEGGEMHRGSDHGNLPYHTTDTELMAGLHQAEAEERLAQNVSQISMEDYDGTGPESGLTKVIPNIKDVIPKYRAVMQTMNPSQAVLNQETAHFVYTRTADSEAADREGESSIIVEEAPDASMMEPIMEPMHNYEEAADYPAHTDASTGGPVPSYPPVMKDVVQESAASAEPETEETDIEEPVQDSASKLEASAVMHLMIESRTPERGLKAAIEALKIFHKEHGFKNQVIKISGLKLSSKGVFASADKIAGKDLVVEEAGDLTETALHELNEVMMKDRTGMRVILIDNPMQIETMCHTNPGLASMFTYIGEDEDHEEIELQTELPVRESSPVEPAFELKKEARSVGRRGRFAAGTAAAAAGPARAATAESARTATAGSARTANRTVTTARSAAANSAAAETAAAAAVMPAAKQPAPAYSAAGGLAEEEMELRAFVDYACQYASGIDCSINGKSMLALYERIEIMEEDGVPLTKANAEDLIEDAADKAEKFSFKKIFTGLFSPKYDKEGLLILREDHFMD